MANANRPLTSWQAAFNADPNDATAIPSWSDITNRVTSWGNSYGRQYELDLPEVGTCNLTLSNLDEAFNPTNTGSAYNSAGNSLLPYRAIRRIEAWPQAGNVLNANNGSWLMTAEDASFEAGTTGDWATTGATVPTLSNSAVSGFNGTHSLLATFASSPGVIANGNGTKLALTVLTGQQMTLSVYVKLTALLTSAQIQTTFGNSAVMSTLGSYQRLSVTFTPTTSPVSMVVAFSGTGAGTANIDAAQVEYASSATAFTTTGPTMYRSFTGYIERYPQRWTDAGFFGWSDMVAVDALGLLATVRLSNCIANDILQDTPTAYYPLTDVTAATPLAASMATTTQPPLGVLQTGTGGTLTLGTGTGPGPDGLTPLTLTPVDSSNGKYLGAPFGAGFGAVVGKFGFEVWFNTTTASRTILAALGTVTLGGVAYQLRLNSTGQVIAEETFDEGGTFTTVTSVATGLHDGTWHHLFLNRSFGSLDLYVDGALDTSLAHVVATQFTATGVQLGASRYPTATATAYTGAIAHVAIYAANLTLARINSHWLSGHNGFSGDLTGTRINRILGWVPWIGATSIGAGATTMAPASGLATSNARDAVQQCADTEQGIFFAAPGGAMTFLARDAYYLKTTSTVTFGEGAGETPYSPDIAYDFDPAHLANEITVTRNGGLVAFVTDTTSLKHYFSRTLNRTIYSDNDDAATFLAQRLLNLYKDPHNRVQVMTINPGANTALWPVALGTKLGDRVTIKRRTSAGLTMSSDYFVEKVAPAATSSSYMVAYALAPVPTYQPWILGDATYGVVGTTTIPVY